MDFQFKKDVPNPRETTNPLSKLFFWWIVPLLRKGFRKNLDVDDIFNPLREDASKKLGDYLEIAWDKEVEHCKLKNKRPKFYRALIAVFGKQYLFLSFFVAIDEWIFRVTQTMCLKWLIESFSIANTEDDKELKQYLYAGGLIVSTLLWTLFMHPAMFGIQHVGMKCRIASSSLIYRKALRLSKSSKAGDSSSKTQTTTTMGQLVNLLANDVNRFDINLFLIPYLVIGPVQALIFSYFLWVELGYSCMGGLGFILLLMPVQYYIGKLFTIFRSQIAKRTDERGRLMSEIIIAMRVIKMYAWEKPFSEMINNVRRLEVKILKKTAFIRAIYMSLFISASKVITFFTFLIYVLTDHPLTADKVFFAVSVYNVMRQVMISFVPVAAAGVGELIVAMNRIETLLLLDEQQTSPNMKLLAKAAPDAAAAGAGGSEPEAALVMENVCASWTGEKLTLDQLNMDLRGDSLVMVVGAVGSGKTSLLHAIIKELPIHQGACILQGSTSYATQEPWIFGGNLRQNILFGLEYEKSRYEDIVTVCALEDDLKQLPFGENTIVGERGVALSGGQKARVNLARALYRQADIYLLDDPLSAVDARVSRHIFEKCIKKFLQGKLRILVTHQLQYLPQADHIIVFSEGQIVAQGSYKELLSAGVDFLNLMANESEEDRRASLVRKEDLIRVKSMRKDAKEIPADKPEEESSKPEVQKEKMAGGSIDGKLYWEYFRSGDSLCSVILLVVGFLLSQLLYSASEVWLSTWTNEEEKKRRNETTTSSGEPVEDTYLGQDVYIWVYSGLTFLIFFVTKARAFLFFSYCMKIGIRVHNRMFGSLIRAPAKFFDDNPSGRVMNRFTKDLGSMDDFLPPAFFDALSIFLLMTGVLVVVIISNYFIAIPAAILIIVLALLRRFYIRTARDVKRIESIARSPLFTHLAGSMQGLTTIRASKAQPILVAQFDGHQDLHSSAWYIFISSTRWFGIWLEMVSICFLTAVTFSFMLITSDALGGNVGLAISSTLVLTGTFQWGMRQSAETENLMTSVERALEYAKLQPEAPLETSPDKKPPPDWPSQGSILFKNVSLAYEEKDVLKGLSFDIRAQEKIGIVGRTGAGKSSIIAALFRMAEPRGQIYIDDICINELGLHDVRRNISIIPQDPVLFSGSVRYNLDPFSQFNDSELWKVLEEVELKESIEALDFRVSDGGANFSVGQRQLVCLARAILRRNKIIVMDEATANVDPRTDNFIQTTIRAKFSDCSIITIAHRLHSVMDCDRILVLDNGYLKEYDHPYTLIQNPSGHLSSMIAHTGRASANILRQIASETFTGRRQSFRVNNLSRLSAAAAKESDAIFDEVREIMDNFQESDEHDEHEHDEHEDDEEAESEGKKSSSSTVKAEEEEERKSGKEGHHQLNRRNNNDDDVNELGSNNEEEKQS